MTSNQNSSVIWHIFAGWRWQRPLCETNKQLTNKLRLRWVAVCLRINGDRNYGELFFLLGFFYGPTRKWYETKFYLHLGWHAHSNYWFNGIQYERKSWLHCGITQIFWWTITRAVWRWWNAMLGAVYIKRVIIFVFFFFGFALYVNNALAGPVIHSGNLTYNFKRS